MDHYSPNTWVDDDGTGTTGTAFSAARMNALEVGLKDATSRVLSVDAVTTDALSLNRVGGTLDGVAVAQGTRALLLGQVSAIDNGVYTYDAFASPRWQRDFYFATVRAGQLISVIGGVESAGHLFMVGTTGTPGVNVITYRWVGGAPGPWHEVGAAGEPAFVNGYANRGGTYETAAFRLNGPRQVAMKGTVTNGTSNVIFTITDSRFLPAKERRITSIVADDGAQSKAASIVVFPDGRVFFYSTVATYPVEEISLELQFDR